MSTAVLLLAHGTPDSVEDIPEYLRNVTSGRAIPDSVITEIQHRYGLIGRSPLTAITLRQGELLAESLSVPVYVGMRNWKPYIAEALRQMRLAGIQKTIAICLAPQNSRTSVGLYRKAIEHNGGDIDIDFVESWHAHPLLISAFAARLENALATHGKQTPVIFTAHSVPARTITDGDPYERQARETGNLVAAKAKLPRSQYKFAFQSQGMSGGPWIGPTVEETMRELREQGQDRVLIQPIGFLCDHVEILYDIDIAFRELGSEIGLQVLRTESLNESPLLIAALAALVSERLSVQAAASNLGEF
ncbi:MAG: ferrochelatase [Acidobacteria bacterium]|nr:ferrochelatase [Acidobacteriota bacterium]MBV9145905.1 ferrochelatase [Acidobacteriota bacterium]MBV9435796.1 ferrochelatase [Acidobacteriota bacterium]